MSDVIRPQTRPIQKSVDYRGESQEPAVKTGAPRVFKPIMHVQETPGKHRVKMLKPGWEGFTGEFAGTRWKDGVSLDLQTETTCDRIAAIMPCEDEDGVPLGAHARIMRLRSSNPDIAAAHVSARLSDVLNAADLSADDAAQAEAEQIASDNMAAALATSPMLSHEQLMAIADEKGIAGLRELAEPYGVRGRSIPDLIVAIMRAQQTAIGGDPAQILVPDDVAVIETT